MKTYKLLPEGFQPLQRKALIQAAALGLVALAVGLYAGTRAASTGSLWVLGLMVPLALGALGFGLHRGLKIQHEGWHSYQLVLDKDSVIQKQVRRPDIEISREQVTGLQETSDGLVIKTQNRHRFIFVPVSLEGYEEVKRYLTQWRTLEPLPPIRAVCSGTVYSSSGCRDILIVLLP